MIALSHPTGNANVRAVLQGLAQKEKLDCFYTTIDCTRLGHFLPDIIKEKLSRRSFPMANGRVCTSPWRDLIRLTAPRFGLTSLTRHESGWASIDQVYRHLDRRVARDLYEKKKSGSIEGAMPLAGVYTYEDCALATFRAAKNLDLRCFYDLPIAYWETSRRLLEEEALRWPAWEPTLVGTSDSAEKMQRKTEEITLADVVICPSQFVYDSLPPEIRTVKQCIVAEFGSPEAPPTSGKNERQHDHGSQGRLRLLFAGSMSQRKGLADLFQAMKILKRQDVELVVMGSPVVSMDFYLKQFPNFTYEPPRPHSKVLELMQSCHVLVLPSIVEGRALVQQEAMICGLPIIVTANAGGSDLIEQGKTGFLVKPGAPEELAEKINWFADHREEIEAMGEQARLKALQVTWDAYREKILDVILR